MGCLSGIRVIDLTRYLAGPYATFILADMGADVIKVEPVELSPEKGRAVAPLFQLPPHRGYQLIIERNKRSIALDITKDEGREIFYRLVKISDVVVENFKPGVADKLKISYRFLREINPKIIYCSITGFGLKGPYREHPAFDLVAQSMAGLVSITGFEGRPAIFGSPISDTTAGMFAVIGILGALRERDASGEGQEVSTSLLSSAFAMAVLEVGEYFISGKDPLPRGLGENLPIEPYRIFRTKDGYIAIAAPYHFEKLCDALSLEELKRDERFKNVVERTKNGDILASIIQNALKEKSTKEWMEIFMEKGIPSSPVNKISEALNHPQILAEELIVKYPYEVGGEIKGIRTPINMSRTPIDKFSPPPLHGEHTKEILNELGYSEEEIREFEEKGIIKGI